MPEDQSPARRAPEPLLAVKLEQWRFVCAHWAGYKAQG